MGARSRAILLVICFVLLPVALSAQDGETPDPAATAAPSASVPNWANDPFMLEFTLKYGYAKAPGPAKTQAAPKLKPYLYIEEHYDELPPEGPEDPLDTPLKDQAEAEAPKAARPKFDRTTEEGFRAWWKTLTHEHKELYAVWYSRNLKRIPKSSANEEDWKNKLIGNIVAPFTQSGFFNRYKDRFKNSPEIRVQVQDPEYFAELRAKAAQGALSDAERANLQILWRQLDFFGAVDNFILTSETGWFPSQSSSGEEYLLAIKMISKDGQLGTYWGISDTARDVINKKASPEFLKRAKAYRRKQMALLSKKAKAAAAATNPEAGPSLPLVACQNVIAQTRAQAQ